MNYLRVLLGRVAVQTIADLFEEHGDRLLQRNIRRYLGLHSNRVNTAIHDTLCSDKADKFYFYNNGITIVCDKFDGFFTTVTRGLVTYLPPINNGNRSPSPFCAFSMASCISV